MTNYLNNAEYQYRRQRIAREVAASRGGRSRSDWLRRLAATDPARPRHLR
ncbi:hypothetical protein JK386_01345 [Nocardioides sp. zg-536]|uniref:Uncharacterized protein n=1 Tax=Nocardioides faecalis TaxID=2803858 RepID=A0A938Y3G8_9ACTN|nr:hypothetical protein [Nocardioides faecalis]MBM9458540.1 hypothetical protein [Nocardioides faecalis]QVI58543.1 hypothetical protein KG111_16435 [Nocardioides faecalis]